MILAHKIALDVNPAQTEVFARAAGCARFTWNWGLAEWKRQYEAGERPTAGQLKKEFNAIKRDEFPWIYESPKDANQQVFAQLGNAFQRFFQGQAAYPNFKKRGKSKDSFYISNDKFEVKGKRIRLPKIGWVKMREALRFSGKITAATVSRTAQRWFVSIQVEIDPPALPSENQAGPVGVDLGVKDLATLSTGQHIEGPKPLRKLLGKLRRLSRQLSRNVKGSANWRKAQMKLARAFSDMGLGEFRRQIEYKTTLYGSDVVVANRWFPSSKMCRICGVLNETLRLSDRVFCCEACGHTEDRDEHAARNLERYPRLLGESNACGLPSAGHLRFEDGETQQGEAGIQRAQLDLF